MWQPCPPAREGFSDLWPETWKMERVWFHPLPDNGKNELKIAKLLEIGFRDHFPMLWLFFTFSGEDKDNIVPIVILFRAGGLKTLVQQKALCSKSCDLVRLQMVKAKSLKCGFRPQGSQHHKAGRDSSCAQTPFPLLKVSEGKSHPWTNASVRETFDELSGPLVRT